MTQEINDLIAEAVAKSFNEMWGGGTFDGAEWVADSHEVQTVTESVLVALEATLGERDAAVAAIERIRVAVSGNPECDRYEDGDVVSCGWKSAYAGVVAALDGAPEGEGGQL